MGARTALKLAELQLARTEISSPYDIRVVSSDVEVGELVGPPEHVGEVARLGVAYRAGALEVDTPIEPNDLRYLDPVIGRSARIRTDFGTYDAEVVRVSAVVAPRTRLASLFLEFGGDLPPESLPLPGSFVEAVLAGPSYEDVYVLPESPEIDLRTVTVGVKFHGATPREIEEDINRRIEESVVGLPGVARVVATAVQGAGSVRIEMAAFADPDTVFDDVQNAVDEIENFPPPGADRPEVSLNRVSLEVMTLAVHVLRRHRERAAPGGRGSS